MLKKQSSSVLLLSSSMGFTWAFVNMVTNIRFNNKAEKSLCQAETSRFSRNTIVLGAS